MAIRTHALIAVILLTTSIAAAGDLDCPRPDLWARYPRIQQEVTHGLAELPYEMAKFQPETFIAKHPALAKMARSDDWAERIRALKAVAALEDPNGIPLLVQAILDAKDAPAVSNASLNEAMNPLTMWIATRAPRKKFKPLAPLFMHILVRTPDWPAVRCRCLQALGNLAESDWLPLVKELLLSRHPAVTNMGAWVQRS